MNRDDYIARLVNLGYTQICAEHIVRDHLAAGLEARLSAHIDAAEHALEVMG